MVDEVRSLIESLEAQGIELWFEGNQLRFRAPQGALPPEARSELAGKRDAVLSSLRQRAGTRVVHAPLSYGQRSLWLVHQDNPASAAYNVAFVVDVRSAVNETALRESLQTLMDRHAILRTTYTVIEGRPTQLIRGYAAAAFDIIRRPGLGDQELHALMDAVYRQPFDLQDGPVLRATLVSRGEQDHVLMICAHHIAVDGWSLLLLLDELRQIYAGLCAGKAPSLPRPETSYADYARWQAQMLADASGESMSRYWLAQLKAPRAQVELPSDRARPVRKSVRGATCEFSIDRALTERLNQLARAEGSTLFVLMLAAFKVLLFRCSGVEDVIVGTPTLGRGNGRFEHTVGHFVNPVPLRSAVQAQLPFRDLLRQVRDTLLEAIEAEAFPLALMVERLQPERDSSRSPLFETIFVLQRFSQFGELGSLLNAGPDDQYTDFGGLRVRPYALNQQEGQFDLGLGLVELGDHLGGAFKYCTDLFDPSTVERLTGLYVELLRSIVADPAQSVGRLRMLSPEQRAAMLTTPVMAPASAGQVLHRRFEAQAARSPRSVALRFEGRDLSYEELNQRSNRVAHRLSRLGAGQGMLVGLCAERGPDLLVGLLGILKAGAAYLPIDPTYPPDRIDFMLADAKVRFLITQQDRPTGLPAFEGVELCVDDPGLAEEASGNPDVPVEPDDLIYVIYTSGSTGRPKGTLLTHRAVDRLLDATHGWYGFDHTDRWTLFHSVAFDFSVWEIWGALAYGGCLVLVPYMVTRTPRAFAQLVRDERVTVLNQTPSAFRQFIQADRELPAGPASLRHVIFGGEALELQALAPWFERHGDQVPRLVNMYGITETCVHVTYRPITWADLEAGRRSVIGVPIPDLRVHVLDAEMEPCPVGVAGEMYVGGPGLALGYLNRPDLTAERFVPDPFQLGERLYRSGDLARRLVNGELEFVGRKDHQVKIRGFRIELGEIEATLSALPSVKQAVVVVGEDAKAGTQLIAYVVGDNLASADLRAALRASLPEFMVPACFVFLEALPLTGNSKVDVRALPAPETQRVEGPIQQPRSPLEAQLLALWRDTLAQPQLGIHDNFFDHGGHSLLAVQLLARVESATGTRLGFAEVFSSPTVAEMASLLGASVPATEATPQPVLDLVARLGTLGVELVAAGDRLRVVAPKGVVDDNLKALIALHKSDLLQVLAKAGQPGLAPASPAPEIEPQPLSHMQQRLWFLKQFDPGNVAYNIPCSIRFQGDVDEDVIERCLVRLLHRHESLRTRFIAIEGEPRILLERDPLLPVERVDLQAWPDEGRETEMNRILMDFTARPFDIQRAPLLRAAHVRLSATEWVLCFVVDHMVCDGLSIGVLLSELRALYTEMKGGAPADLAPIPVQYLELMARQRQSFEQGALVRHLDFWKAQLEGLAPVLQLPTDRPRPPVQTYRGDRRSRVLASDLTERLRAMGRQTGATPFMILLSAFQILLHRYAGVDDVAVGTAVSNRSQRDAAGVVGFFANNVVLRNDLSGRPTALEFIAKVRETFLASMAHQEMPFDALVDALVTRREVDHSPLFQVLFVLQNWATPRMELPGGFGELMVFEGTTARYDLSVDIFAANDGMAAYFEFNTDLFDAGTIDRMMGHYESLLDDLLARPQARIDELVMLGEAERQLVLNQWNATRAPYAAEQTVHGLFEAQVTRSPDAVAVRFENEALTYAELNARANRLAHHLRSLGAGNGELVGVWLERGPDMVVAVLGILKAGAAYVPLDPAFPKDRIDYMMEDAELRVVVTQSALAGGLPQGVQGVSLDADAATLSALSPLDLMPISGASDLAYVIYTSGSTGRPKGVMLEHRSVVNFLLSMHRQPGISASDRFVAVTTLSFDIAGLEIHGPLTVGGTVVLASRATALDGLRLAALLDSSEATLLQATPATWRLLLESGWRGRPGLKMLCGGEGLPRDLADKLLATGGELWNMYGPTETTIWSTVDRVTDTSRAISIGRPIDNTQVYVLEPSGLPAPIGVGGELCIGGDGLARGYRNRDDLTAEKFVTLDLPGVGPTRVYRTGDVVRYLADGRLEFVGRRDHQVKVRGFRIELGEIETVLARHPGVKECVVHVREDTPGDQRLVAYVVPQPETTLETDAMRATLRVQLPEYMVPNLFVVLEAMPLTPNGKVDRKALPVPTASVPSADEDASDAVMNPVQRRVAALWRSVLSMEHVGLHANFFDIGGHSLLLVRLQAALQREFGHEFPLVELFQRTTVAAQAERLAAPAGGSDALERAKARAARQIKVQG